MNPFRPDIYQTIKNIIRTTLWVALAINCGILAYFSIWFALYFCSFGWRWAVRTWFSQEWGVP
jgi:hypothetical protein